MVKKKKKLVSGYYDANTGKRVTDANIVEDEKGWRIVKNKPTVSKLPNKVSSNTESQNNNVQKLKSKRENLSNNPFRQTTVNIPTLAPIVNNNMLNQGHKNLINQALQKNISDKTKASALGQNNYQKNSGNENTTPVTKEGLRNRKYYTDPIPKKDAGATAANSAKILLKGLLKPFESVSDTVVSGIMGTRNPISYISAGNSVGDLIEDTFGGKDEIKYTKGEKASLGKINALKEQNKINKGLAMIGRNDLMRNNVKLTDEDKLNLQSANLKTLTGADDSKERWKNYKKSVNKNIAKDVTGEFSENIYKDAFGENLNKKSYIDENSFAGKAINTTGQGLSQFLMSFSTGSVGGATGSKLTKKALEMAPVAASGYGGGLEEAYNITDDEKAAKMYALGSATIEVFTESITGSVPGLGESSGIDYLADKGINKISNRITRELTKIGYRMNGEGFEEGLSNILGTYLKQKTIDPNAKLDWGSVAEDYMMGAISAGVVELPTNIANSRVAIREQNIKNQLKKDITPENAQSKVEELIDKGYEPEISREIVNESLKETNQAPINFNNETINKNNIEKTPINTDLEQQNTADNTNGIVDENSSNKLTKKEIKTIAEEVNSQQENKLSQTVEMPTADNKSNLKLEQRVAGDKLLDAQDLIEEIKTVGAKVDNNGYVTVYHQTTPEAAQKIRETGKMTSKEADVFFSTSENAQQADGKGNVKLEFKIPAERLVLDDLFSDNADVKVMLHGLKELDVSKYIVDNNSNGSLKQRQLDIIKDSNPMQDDYHTGIRTIEDIKTLEETLNDSDYEGYDEFNPDLTRQDIEKAIKKRTITVYSSYPIENGVFVSPSKMEAESYSGNGKVYSKEVSINDVAWIDPTQGQYAKAQNNIPINENRTSTFSDNLMTFTQNEADSILRSEKNVIVNNKQELKRYVLEAINDNQSNKNIYLGVIPKSTITNIINKVTDISEQNRNELFADNKEYQLAVNQEEIRHLNKESLSEQDVVNFIDSLDELIANFDTVRFTLYNGNQKGLRFKKNMNDGTHIAVEILSKQKGTMRTQTLFLDKADFIANKKRSIAPTLDELNSPSKTSKMDGGLTPSDNNDTTKTKKSQVAPSQYSMQQNEKNDTKKVNAPISEELKKKVIRDKVKAKKNNNGLKSARTAAKIAKNKMDLSNNEKNEFRKELMKYKGYTKEKLTNARTYNEIKDIVKKYADREITYANNEINDIKDYIRKTKIAVTEELKNSITDYNDFRKSNFGKLKLSNEGMSIDSLYEELSETYPGYFSNEIDTEEDRLYAIADFMNEDSTITEKYSLDDKTIDDITAKVFNTLQNNAFSEEQIEEFKKEISDRMSKITRKSVREMLQRQMGMTAEDLSIGKDIKSLNYQLTDPIRVNEKVFGRELGNKINDETIRKTTHNEAKKIKWLNSERNDIKELGIKPRSKESAAVQKYGEKKYLNKYGESVSYGDKELMTEFPNVKTQEKIKRAAEMIRNKYDKYIDEINQTLTALGYDAIPKREDYMRHFQELGDIFSKTGVPFNLNDMKAEDLPTDINGLTEFNRPGKNYFASAQRRIGQKTVYDAITGIDGYLEGAGNLIYHTGDIQRYRALSSLIRDSFGSSKGFDNLGNLTDAQAEQRINDILDNKLSRYAAWLDEQANTLAGKKGAIDRGAERFLGRRVYTGLNTIKKQVGSNMTGFNVRSAMTNLISSTIASAKTNKLAFVKGTVSTINNMFKNDGFIEKSDFLTTRFGSDQLSKKLWQKASNAGQIFMTGTDYFTANQITRSKYYEGLQKGMSESDAIKYADDFASRVMGDRSLGRTAEAFNSKTLGLLTQFQLEVNNQWQYMIHDTKMDFQKNSEINNGLKAGATALFQMGQLAAFSYFFNEVFQALTGSRAAFDPIDIFKKLFGSDDDKDKPWDERISEANKELFDNIPFGNLFTGGGRIPISEAFTGLNTFTKKITGQKNKYGSDIAWEDVKDDTLASIPYYFLPTGYSQIKKTKNGLSMFSKDKEIKGSYTKSGRLRFPVKDTAKNRIQAGLFGEYSSSEARKYFDEKRSALTDSQQQMYKTLKIPVSDYWKINKQINSIKNEFKGTDTPTEERKEKLFKYVDSLDVSKINKSILKKSIYKSYKDDDYEIKEHINSSNMSKQSKKELLEKLGLDK